MTPRVLGKVRNKGPWIRGPSAWPSPNMLGCWKPLFTQEQCLQHTEQGDAGRGCRAQPVNLLILQVASERPRWPSLSSQRPSIQHGLPLPRPPPSPRDITGSCSRSSLNRCVPPSSSSARCMSPGAGGGVSAAPSAAWIHSCSQASTQGRGPNTSVLQVAGRL